VPPLTLPPAVDGHRPDEYMGCDALRLFLDRARLCDPRFEAADGDVAIVAELCRRLDGIPLAIELAAAQVRSLTVAQIDRLLDDRFRLLVAEGHAQPAHHATLRAAIDWSYDLLAEPDRALFRRLAVFRGGWILEAAEAVGGDGPAASDFVPAVQNRLVARSLIAVEDSSDGRRYRMLETIRQYARGRLVESGEADAVRERHLRYYLDLARAAAPELTGGGQADWLARLDAERDNVDAALRWAHERALADLALSLAGDAARYWELRGHFSHGRDWLNRLLALPSGGSPTAVRAKALRAAGSLAEEQADYGAARDHYRQALAISQQLEDMAAVAESLSDLGNVADFQADYASARSLHEEALSIRRGLGEKRPIAVSLNNLGNVADFQGEYQRARELYEESLALMRESGDRWAVSVLLNNLGRLDTDQGRLAEAGRHLAESLEIARELGDRQGIAYALHNLGEVARLQGDLGTARRLQCDSLSTSAELGNSQGVAASLEALALVTQQRGHADRAVQLLAAADSVRRRIGAPVSANEHDRLRDTTETLRHDLGERSFESIWEAGRRMSEADAVTLALEVS
jgi:tetratricopeptide (TPR) repeat protein